MESWHEFMGLVLSLARDRLTILIEAFEQADLGGLFILALVLLAVGNKASENRASLRAAGFSVAAGALLIFLVYEHLGGKSGPSSLAEIAWRGLLGSGVVLGVAWIVFAILAALHRATLTRLARSLRSSWQTTLQSITARVAARATEHDRQAEQEQQRRQELLNERRLATDRQRAREEAERRQEEQRRAAADLAMAKQAARQHVKSFYDDNADLLGGAFPVAMLEAFLHGEMHDAFEVPQLWATGLKKIAELQALVVQERERRRKTEDRRAARNVRSRKIESEISACHQKIARLEKSGLDPEMVADETMALLQQIRRLEDQKELLAVLNDEGE